MTLDNYVSKLVENLRAIESRLHEIDQSLEAIVVAIDDHQPKQIKLF